MISKKYGNLLLKSAAVSALCAGMAMSVAAQDQADDQVVSVDTATDDNADESRQDVVRVTGSRLSNEYTSIAPIDVISADVAALEGIADVATLLQTATVAAGSPQVTAATSTQFVQAGGEGAETVSLRGLGASRTLTLINGRRAGKAGTRGQISAFDLNAIPLSAVQNIEVLKDGASSVYGSDAVAGVVNIITKSGDTSELDFFYSGPEEQGGEQLRASGAWGKDLDRGSFLLTFDYTKNEELAQGDRSYFECGEEYYFDAAGDRADLINPATGTFNCNDAVWGHVWIYDYVDAADANGFNFASRPWQTQSSLLQYDYDGSLGQFLPPFGPSGAGIVAPADWYAVDLGGQTGPNGVFDPYYGPTALLSEALVSADHPFQNTSTLVPEVERMTIYGSGEYEINEHMDVYGEFLLNRRETKVNGYRQFWTYQYLYAYDYGNGSAFLFGDPTAIANGWGFSTAQPLAPFTAPPFSVFGLSPTGATDHSDSQIEVQYANFVAGARGNFDAALADWNYDVFFQFSQSDGDYTNDVIYDDAITPYEFQTALCDSVVGANGAGTTTVRGVPCVDVNWYNPALLNGDLPDAERDFLFGTETGNTIYEQAQFEAFFDGPLFEMPAGTVQAGFGFNRLRERINDVPAEVFQVGNAWGSSSAGITRGSTNTTAIFGEMAIPLLKDKPLAEAVDLSLSGRWTDVDAYGDGTTYKVGLGWQATSSIRGRATYGTSFRAPALFELFLDAQSSFARQRTIDPCINYISAFANGDIGQRRFDNCAADLPAGVVPGGGGGGATVFASGNAGDLEAETSTALNVGLIYAPDWIDFRASIDYFEIEVQDQIAQLGAANILLGCYESDNFATEPLCDLFTRTGSLGLVDEVTNNYINIAEQTNKGIDFQADYGHEFSFGTLRVDTQWTYQMEDELLLFPSSDPIDTNGEAGDPEWVGELNLTFERGPWDAFWGMNYVDVTSNIDSNGGNTGTIFGEPVVFKLKTEPVTYHSASIGRELPNDFTVRVGVSNVFDEHPPSVTTLNLGEYSTVGTSAFYSQYDWLGRRFFLNVNKKF
jgi:iron complex outermembrane receptor protein